MICASCGATGDPACDRRRLLPSGVAGASCGAATARAIPLAPPVLLSSLGEGHDLVRIDGSCVGVQKARLLDAFRDRKQTLVALCSIKACGTGTDGMQVRSDPS